MPPKHVDRMANSVDPDQTAPYRSSLIRIYTVCSDIHVPIFKIFTVVNICPFFYLEFSKSSSSRALAPHVVLLFFSACSFFRIPFCMIPIVIIYIDRGLQ